MADAQGTRVVVIDEVQKLPAVLDEVHRLIEKRGFRFVLTGSSARKLRRSGANLLAGRTQTLTMHPFTASELGRTWEHGLGGNRGTGLESILRSKSTWIVQNNIALWL